MNPQAVRRYFALTFVALLHAVPCAAQEKAASKGVLDARELLQLADSAFVRMPLDPHIKNRGRGQMMVVDACIDQGMIDVALRVAATIPDWRKGLGYARCAMWLQQHNRADEVPAHLAAAEQVAAAVAADPSEQAWRSERILATVARVRFSRGELEAFAKASKDIGPVEGAGIQEDVALRMPEQAFDKWIEQADATIASAQFDAIHSTLQCCAKLYRRFFADEKKRATLEDRIVNGYARLPLHARAKLLVEIGGVAADMKDGVRTLAICGHIETTLAKATWRPEDRVPALADLAELLHRAGDATRGKQQLDDAAALYAEQQKSILDIYRAAPLRSLAEAAWAMGDTARAMEFWRRAAEAGVENPNSRPRADDLAATCVSIVQSGALPDAELGARLRAIEAALGAPW
jgi:hypothetical protein